MRYTAKQYAELLFEVTYQKDEYKLGAIIKRFVRMLQRHNAVSLYKKVLAEFSQIYNNNLGISEVQVVSARPLSKRIQDQVEKQLPAKSNVAYSIDTTLIGGVKVIINNALLIDGSIKKRIEHIFKS